VPVAVWGLAHDERVSGADRIAVAPDLGLCHCLLLLSVGLAGAGEVGGLLEPGRDREQRAGLLGE
jgi:hypothetical protein